jgi:hypothetical protein
LGKKKGEELTKDSTGIRHPLPSDGTVTRGAVTSSSSDGTATVGPYDGTATGGGWHLHFLRWDFFLRRDYDNGALWGWDLLFLRWDCISLRLRQRDLLFNNAHALHVGGLLFIIHYVHHQLEWRDWFVTEVAT